MKKLKNAGILLVLALAVVFVVSGCAGMAAPIASALGTAMGAGTGAVIGNQSGNPVEGALIGGAVGAGLGYAIGNEYNNRQMQRRIDDAMTTVVNVHNSNGSTTPVRIRRVGSHYIGPHGEEYEKVPSEAQLKKIYGF